MQYTYQKHSRQPVHVPKNFVLRSPGNRFAAFLSEKNARSAQNIFFVLAVFLFIAGIFTIPFLTQAAFDLPGTSLPELNSTNGNNTFNDFVRNQALPTTRILFQGVAVFYILFFGIRMVFSANDEASKKARLGLLYAVVGFIFLNVGEFFFASFVPRAGLNEPSLFDWKNIISIVITALRGIAGTVAIVSIIISGYQIVISSASGADDAAAKYRRQILWSILGLIVIALAGEFQRIAFEGDVERGHGVIGSLLRLMLLFVVPIGFAGLILGGFYFIFSGANDSLRTKGIKIVQGTLIAMVIIYSAYTVVTEVLKFAAPIIL